MIFFSKHVQALSLLGAFSVAALATGIYFLMMHEAKPAEPVSSVKEAYIRCIESSSEKQIGECLSALATYAYQSYEIDDVTAVLDTLSYEQKDYWCHEAMHYMGWEAYRTEGDVASAFLNASELCDSGMYHGITEEFLRTKGLGGDIEALIANICEEALISNPELSDGTKSLCYHGLGHGLMYITSSDLQKSLDYCDLLPPDHSSECYGGVFMEYAATKQVGPLSERAAPDLEDFTYCETLDEKQRTACYGRQGVNNLIVTKGDVREAMRLCLALPSGRQYSCFQGVGSNTPSPGRSHADAAQACMDAIGVADSAYRGCITGALGFVTQLDRGDTSGIVAFCEASAADMQHTCYAHAGSVLRDWLVPGETLESKCSTLPTRDAENACLSARSL